MINIVIPMAGEGKRFRDAGYTVPKPFIDIRGKPMIVWSLLSLPFADLPQRPAKTEMKVTPKDFIFVCRRDHDNKFKITDKLRKLFSNKITVVFVEQVTRGAAETVLAAKEHINTDKAILVSDSDHYFDGGFLYEKIVNKDSKTQGIIPVFRPPDNDPKWSFSLVEKDNVIVAVGEKDKKLADMGALANIGGYYFTHGSVYVNEAEEMIAQNDLSGDEGKKEFYVAPVYNRLIKKGMKIVAAITPKVWGLGTPKDVEAFEKEDVSF